MKVKTRVWRELGAFVLVGLAVGAVMMLASCSAPSGGGTVAPSAAPLQSLSSGGEGRAMKSEQAAAEAMIPERRPGLGTGWGEEVKSSLGRTWFERESSKPFGGVGMIYYNDKEGVEAMAGKWKNQTGAMQKAANGVVEWGVKQGWSWPKHYLAGGKRFVVGKKGKTYSILVRNVSEGRLEIVLSVDGLDVMDGKAASFKKRGYILGPGEEIEVKGFRTSYDAVAAFKFSSVAASYSNLRHGTTRDVGVIGLVVFAEKGRGPWKWGRGEVRERREAQPFAEAPLRTVGFD